MIKSNPQIRWTKLNVANMDFVVFLKRKIIYFTQNYFSECFLIFTLSQVSFRQEMKIRKLDFVRKLEELDRYEQTDR